MITIWKFKLTEEKKQRVQMPRGAKILSAQSQRNDLCLWAMVDSTQPVVERTIICFGTGDEIKNDQLRYIGTTIFNDGYFVVHVFEVIE